MTQTIRKWDSRMSIGTIETDSRGNKTVRAFSGRILGYYKKDQDVTTNFMGKMLYIGDMASALLITEQ